MRRYNILQPLLLAFYSKSLYKDVHQNWRGLVFAYLLLLAIFCSLPIAYHLDNRITNSIFLQKAYSWLNDFPTLTINYGKLSINKPVPYYIKHIDSNEVFIIFDTSASANINLLEHSTAQLLITDKQMFVKKNEHEIKTYNFAKMGNNIYTPAKIARVFEKNIYVILFWLLYLVFLSLFFIIGIIEAIVYAALAKLFVKSSLPYDDLLRLSIIAITPQFIIFTLSCLFFITIPYKWILYFALGMGYLFFAMEANHKGKTES